jgi:uncharacterized protein YaiE (UPF0345 family)
LGTYVESLIVDKKFTSNGTTTLNGAVTMASAAMSGIGDLTAATGLSGGWDLGVASAAAATAGQTVDITGQAGGTAATDGAGKAGGNVTITAGAGSAKNGSGTPDGNGGDLVLSGGARGGATGGATIGAVLIGSPTLATTKAANMLGVAGAFEVDGASQFDGAVQFNGSVTGGAVTNDLNGGAFILDPTGSTILRAQVDDTVTMTSASATGTWGVKTGNLTVGAGTPGLALNGQDAYVSDHLEVDGVAQFDGAVTTNSTLAADGGLSVDTSNFTVSGSTGAVATLSSVSVGTWVKLGAAAPISVTGGATIAPTGTYQPLTSASGVTCNTTTCIANGTTAGDLLILSNANVSDTITIDGAGGNVECKSDIILGTGDTLMLIWNGSDWNCLGTHDNS